MSKFEFPSSDLDDFARYEKDGAIRQKIVVKSWIQLLDEDKKAKDDKSESAGSKAADGSTSECGETGTQSGAV